MRKMFSINLEFVRKGIFRWGKTVPVTWSDEKLILLYCPGRGSNSQPSARRSVNMIKVSYALTTRPRRMNLQTWTKVGVNQSSHLTDSLGRLLNCWPHKTCKVPPMCLRGTLFSVYSFPDESAHVCQIWCQSVQPFNSFSRICAKVSSAL